MALFRLSSPRFANGDSSLSTTRRLQVFVLFDGVESTAKALRTAARFLSDLGGEIHVAAALVVPYPLPLDTPPCDQDWLLSQIESALSLSGVAIEKCGIKVAYGRDKTASLRSALSPHSIVVMGHSGWSTTRLVRKLGHEVIIAHKLP